MSVLQARPAGADTAPGTGAAPRRARPRLSRGRRRGALLLPAVMLCFVGSIGIRLAGSTGAALASGVERLIPAMAHGMQSAGGGDAAANPAPACPADPDLTPILDRLAAREARLTAGEQALAERQQTLAVAEARITRRLADLKAAEEELSRTMARASVAAEDDLSKLTAVYEAMKPKDAVPLFEAMAPDFAAGFLGRMRTDAAGAIMAGMAPDRAYAVSVILAGRNASVPVPPDVAAVPAEAGE
ncbi:MotE family protein [Frigidibacter sp. ROC022]|uniref:MotE family protein n=1 Tax=Frigidibacter sp. ROC022 TaxID=2971796 RepID=UPI00215A2395|nr:hypothetical protein [Frigidibacter sp. ROC022]MCR8724356.1 hypothetical protein [Frigidibacter sp. ROC022]